MKRWTVRTLRPLDREPMHKALVRCTVFTPEEIAVALELMDIYLTQPAQTDYHFVACADEKNMAVGYLCIGKRSMTRGTFDMYWIVTDPAYQGRGVGTRLNEYAEQYVIRHGGLLLLAETSSKNAYEATRQFYVTRGYSELARIKDCYAPGDDLITYGKYLSQA